MKNYYIVVFDLNNNGTVLKHFSDLKECIKYFRKYCSETVCVHYSILEEIGPDKYFVLYD